jgi:thioredoxin-related protein
MLKKVYEYSSKQYAPCETYKKIFESISNLEKYKELEFKQFDIDENELDVEKYNIKALPTTIFIDENDEMIYKLSGNIALNDLVSITEDFLKRDKNNVIKDVEKWEK